MVATAGSSEDELAERILQRAQLAQWKRQLKVGLNQTLGGYSAGNPGSARKRSSGIDQADFTARDSLQGEVEVERETGTGTATAASEADLESREDGSPWKKHQADRTPLKQRQASVGTTTLAEADRQRTSGSTPVRHYVKPRITPTKLKTKIETGTPEKASGGHTADQKFTTPKSTAQVPIRNHSVYNDTGEPLGLNSTNNSAGADLLIYLATSPYSSATRSQQQHQQQNPSSRGTARIPTTPSSSIYGTHHHTDANDAIRLSNLKHSMSSPQSTFKVPHTVGSSGFMYPPSSSSSAGVHAFNSDLMESPSLYSMSQQHLTPRKRTGPPRSATELAPIPTTPSRELTAPSSASHNLLKTPNFNMGDYIHNIFSPSPRITGGGGGGTPAIRRGSINSIASISLMNTAGNSAINAASPAAPTIHGNNDNNYHGSNVATASEIDIKVNDVSTSRDQSKDV
ncbi:Stb1p KNAG_0K02450 [Huiozyma naganishii CBS 8797]|uniref:Uncharacterized protein n=1 Tax=Huiozyma naganishii (strain ATCC MYA-139 / BCRC 22969 / CBS 8797 / KCTC 17520 / NBRC 10181 / NCYC 3082 / Yp74L-3) TaxID=1071383 RepID=J7RRV5_HUIN7|nr:hypothetical protein KNAG_0K02450 [Kazachstania naganishii CBS 8797]CCK72608.1 hypothetical protein KNAG_0K02450 [Kazachstania naganishii CBS 8797]